ncbi:hypothetical protein IC1_06071 [Bacillus cereus VD022]|uniref:Uncharacterized protein n=1 Tax=Bacillus cereus TIAC219 TaxID=718222 RepID=A0ABC9SPI6_BACCE|nr:hypothetical protein IC1_06071 [Bacillus cereus VD022]EOQ56303.1 hypothetical protein IAY_05732 [Bacillus cereus TIAC219]
MNKNLLIIIFLVIFTIIMVSAAIMLDQIIAPIILVISISILIYNLAPNKKS